MVDEHARPILPNRGETAAHARDEENLSTARGLARQHADAIRTQIAQATGVSSLGTVLVDMLTEYLTAPSAMDAAHPARRLIGLNPDRQSLSALMATAAKLVETGTKLKRQALAMDLTKDAVVSPTARTTSGKILRDRLSPEALMSLRKAVQEASRRVLAPSAEPEETTGDA